jgi:aspartate racemase
VNPETKHPAKDSIPDSPTDHKSIRASNPEESLNLRRFFWPISLATCRVRVVLSRRLELDRPLRSNGALVCSDNICVRTLGIIGGIGPESTVDYYRSIVAEYREQIANTRCPAILINSIDLKRMLDLVAANDLGGLTEYLLEELEKLVRAGADLGLFAANTPHIVFDEIRCRSSIPLISIVEATCRAAQALGLRKVGLLGARFTMQAQFYPSVCSKAGISIVVPAPEEQMFVHDKYMNELVNGMFLSETRDGLLAIIESLIERERIDGMILGGTELPLLLRGVTRSGVPFLDTTQIHVKAAIAEMLRP